MSARSELKGLLTSSNTNDGKDLLKLIGGDRSDRRRTLQEKAKVDDTPTPPAKPAKKAATPTKVADDENVCQFCKEGKHLITIQVDGAALKFHKDCVLWCPDVLLEKGEYVGLEEAYRRGRKLKCALCKKNGATNSCLADKCRKSYHLECAKKDNCSFTLSVTDKRVFHCPEHSEENVFTVKEIRDVKFEKGVKKFLINWLGYGDNENTWEPEEHLPPQMVEEYEESLKAAKKGKKRGREGEDGTPGKDSKGNTKVEDPGAENGQDAKEKEKEAKRRKKEAERVKQEEEEARKAKEEAARKKEEAKAREREEKEALRLEKEALKKEKEIEAQRRKELEKEHLAAKKAEEEERAARERKREEEELELKKKKEEEELELKKKKEEEELELKKKKEEEEELELKKKEEEEKEERQRQEAKKVAEADGRATSPFDYKKYVLEATLTKGGQYAVNVSAKLLGPPPAEVEMSTIPAYMDATFRVDYDSLHGELETVAFAMEVVAVAGQEAAMDAFVNYWDGKKRAGVVMVNDGYNAFVVTTSSKHSCLKSFTVSKNARVVLVFVKV